jgi:hypothetical protein
MPSIHHIEDGGFAIASKHARPFFLDPGEGKVLSIKPDGTDLRVPRITEALDDPDGGREAAQALRSLIGEIVLTPGEKRGEVQAELRGELMGILDSVNAEENQKAGGVMRNWGKTRGRCIVRRVGFSSG